MPQLKQFKERKGYLGIKAIKHLKMKMKINTSGEGRVSIYLQKLPPDIDLIYGQEVQFDVLAAKKYVCR